MVILLTIVHIIVCLFLVIVVLLQSGKAADLAGAFGGMGSQTAFGARGSATVLSKATTLAAAIFMMTSMTLAIFSTRGGAGGASSVLESQGSQAEQTAPATPPTAGAEDPLAGQPSITLTDPATGESETVPLDIPPRPEGSSAETPAEGQPDN